MSSKIDFNSTNNTLNAVVVEAFNLKPLVLGLIPTFAFSLNFYHLNYGSHLHIYGIASSMQADDVALNAGLGCWSGLFSVPIFI